VDCRHGQTALGVTRLCDKAVVALTQPGGHWLSARACAHLRTVRANALQMMLMSLALCGKRVTLTRGLRLSVVLSLTEQPVHPTDVCQALR
jgi:hypothetical protein